MHLETSNISCCDDLLCTEDAHQFTDESPALQLAHFPDDSDESMAEFIEGESQYSPAFDYLDRFRSNSLDPLARQLAVAWFIKVSDYYSFKPLTAYLAVNYMDRFISSHRLPQNGWALQLLSVACISLAAKMEETLVPSLLDLQIEGAKYIFEPRTVLRMELLLLNALRWRLRSVTPFTFIDFFAYKIDPSGKSARHLISCATQIILETMHDIDFISHCPSSLAAAAILCATDEIEDLAFTNPGIAVSWCIGLTEDGIASCYKIMRRTVINRMPKKCPVILTQLRVTTNSSVSLSSGLSSTSSSSYSEPNKRRKLNTNYLRVNDT